MIFTSTARHHRNPKAAKTLDIEDPGHLGFDYQLRFSSRKTIGLQVRNGQVRVSGPHHVSRRELEAWLESKLKWIRSKLEEQEQEQEQYQPPLRRYVHGEIWPLMGDDFRLLLQSGHCSDSSFGNGVLLITLSKNSEKPESEQVVSALTQWYRQQALEILTQKTLRVCAELGAEYSAIRLRRTRSKWGHCTPRRVIQYNWLIVQAPEWVIDYLVIHECCHLIHLNHSPQYWNLVAQLMPNYKQAKQWLNQNGYRLIV